MVLLNYSHVSLNTMKLRIVSNPKHYSYLHTPQQRHICLLAKWASLYLFPAKKERPRTMECYLEVRWSAFPKTDLFTRKKLGVNYFQASFVFEDWFKHTENNKPLSGVGPRAPPQT
uniref:Uncharacterized protein n=1 Tax=Sphaerodactylus townsendi TaxID=933632 RepID=A0ACB8GCN3_9SAUR